MAALSQKKDPVHNLGFTIKCAQSVLIVRGALYNNIGVVKK